MVGLGKPDTLKLDSWRQAAAVVARLAKRRSAKRWESLCRYGMTTQLEQLKRSQKASSWLCSKTIALSLSEEQQGACVEQVDLLGLAGQDEAIARASHLSGVILARELVAAPANSVTPLLWQKRLKRSPWNTTCK